MSVLSAEEIKNRVDLGDLIAPATFNENSLRPAAYDVTIAKDGLTTPHGKPIPPGSNSWLQRNIVLDSGDTAMLSSSEMFCMPHDIAGNLTIRNRLANEGLILLSGMLIDPGYGLEAENQGTHGSRLYLHVANIGRESIVLRPGRDTIVRVQFLPVFGVINPNRKYLKQSRWSDQQPTSLGFLTEMKELKEEVWRSETRSQQVMLFGWVVLAVALIGAEFTTILSIVTNTTLRTELDNVWGSSPRDRELWAVLLLGLPVAALTIVLVLRCGARAVASLMRRRRRR